MKATPAVFLAALFFSACINATAQKPAKFKRYNTKEYVISHPQDWRFDFSGMAGTRFILLAPADSDTDNFSENFNLLIQNLSGYNIVLAEYTRLSVEEIKNSIENSALLSMENKTGKNGPFSRIIFSGSQADYQLIWIQDYYKVRNNMYLLTFSCEKDAFDRYKPLAEKIMETFRIK